jgi:hypothetical protein
MSHVRPCHIESYIFIKSQSRSMSFALIVAQDFEATLVQVGAPKTHSYQPISFVNSC